MGSFGQKHDGNAETSIASKLHQYACMEHRHGCWSRCVTVGRPCVEGEERAKHAKSDEYEGEKHLLYALWNVVQGLQFEDVHRGCTTEEVDADDADDEQSRTTHKHEG